MDAWQVEHRHHPTHNAATQTEIRSFFFEPERLIRRQLRPACGAIVCQPAKHRPWHQSPQQPRRQRPWGQSAGH
jgi:hypothetical protein